MTTSYEEIQPLPFGKGWVPVRSEVGFLRLDLSMRRYSIQSFATSTDLSCRRYPTKHPDWVELAGGGK